MPSYKIHSIKNDKKLSFIIEGESSEKIKQSLSLEGYIIITIDEIQEEENKIPRFVFEAIKENNTRIEGKIDAVDIFSAYTMLKNDYQYTLLKLYPINVTDPIEQGAILKNILEIFPENVKINKEESKNKTSTELGLLKGYLDILESCIKKTNQGTTDTFLYDIKRIKMMNNISSAEELIKKIIKNMYNNRGLDEKKALHKTLSPIADHVGMLIFPPWIFQVIATIEDTVFVVKILFGGSEKKETKKNISSPIKLPKKKNTPEKDVLNNKNILLLLKKRYMSSWVDIFKSSGSYLYIYSFLRQYRIILWLKIIQQYIGILSIYSCFLFIFGIILLGIIFTPGFLVFNGFMIGIMSIIVISLVFFFKEI